MPLYEYSCDECGHRFEAIQKFSDTPIKKCERCKGAVTKLISPPGLSFKGSGWYITDYSSKSRPPESKETSGAEKGSGEAGSEDTSKDKKAGGESIKTDSPAPSNGTSSKGNSSTGQTATSGSTSKP